VALGFVIVLAGLGLAAIALDQRATLEAAAVQAPRFEVDPLWPKPLPNKWILGQTIGVSVDAQDHISIIHRAGSLEPGEVHATTKPPTAQCCAPAPPVLAFDEAEQKYLYLADGENAKVHVLLRDTLEILTSFAEGGRELGEFYGVHSIATDSKGNIFTTETYRGQRVQKFTYRGLAPVTKKDQGVVWPKK
jgi:hypothetical protein